MANLFVGNLTFLRLRGANRSPWTVIVSSNYCTVGDKIFILRVFLFLFYKHLRRHSGFKSTWFLKYNLRIA